MTDVDLIDPALEESARHLLRVATINVRPTHSLDERIDGVVDPPAHRRRWTPVAAALVLIVAASWAVVVRDVATPNVVVRDPVTSGVRHWWTGVGPEWTDLPSPGVQVRAAGALATSDGVTVWEAQGAGDVLGTASSVTLGGSGRWTRSTPGQSVLWGDAITVRRSAGLLLVALTMEDNSYRVTAVSSEATTDLGPVDPLVSHLGAAPVLLRGPQESGGEAWVFSHVDGDPSKGLEFSRVAETERSTVDRIEVPNLRPLAVGVTPAGETMIVTQVIASTRVGSMVTVYAQVDGEWVDRGSTTFAEAEAVWAGDRFVVASNQAGEFDGPADMAVQFATGASAADTRWDLLDSPAIGSCESPIELIEDGAGGVVATSCGVSAFLPSASKSWRPVPAVDGFQSTFLIAAWDGRLIAEGLYDVEAGASPLVAIDMNP